MLEGSLSLRVFSSTALSARRELVVEAIGGEVTKESKVRNNRDKHVSIIWYRYPVHCLTIYNTPR